ncbi:O-antigen/teichoic acid export membrane protein [Mesonia hippocampi]|uniref:O-antigen/teichoic acid export membrane protein n=1 Tax=Mesonia hippocampi TaxID=1628250 RepID=A0A840EJU3_9FLAO|nr:hypothetical protein [Mesonia hippocampi]MBB4118418.1 O-antigen/teichoic acid export membrane protein [Mesonia hippocampi]
MKFINKKYIIYGTSIAFSRGLEYLVLLYAAYFLSKEAYGELEFYKKIIESLTVFFAFGLPSLLLTYTRSKLSKIYFFTLSFLFLLLLGVLSIPFFIISESLFLLIPVLFHAIFFNNGILPVYFLTDRGSNTSAIYKSIISFFFYIGVLLLLIFSSQPQYSFISINYILFPFAVIYIGKLIISFSIDINRLKKYYRLFKKMILNTLTLVVSNFANIMFLYTDIMIIKLISENANNDIANYSFVLNIANMLIFIPLTIVQVDVESIKKENKIKNLDKRIGVYSLFFLLFLLSAYLILINTYYENYSTTMYLFLTILAAKFFQSQSVLFGACIIIQKRYKQNLYINIFILLFNLIISFLFFKLFGLIGIALGSLLSLAIRYVILRYYVTNEI